MSAPDMTQMMIDIEVHILKYVEHSSVYTLHIELYMKKTCVYVPSRYLTYITLYILYRQHRECFVFIF